MSKRLVHDNRKLLDDLTTFYEGKLNGTIDSTTQFVIPSFEESCATIKCFSCEDDEDEGERDYIIHTGFFKAYINLFKSIPTDESLAEPERELWDVIKREGHLLCSTKSIYICFKKWDQVHLVYSRVPEVLNNSPLVVYTMKGIDSRFIDLQSVVAYYKNPAHMYKGQMMFDIDLGFIMHGQGLRLDATMSKGRFYFNKLLNATMTCSSDGEECIKCYDYKLWFEDSRIHLFACLECQYINGHDCDRPLKKRRLARLESPHLTDRLTCSEELSNIEYDALKALFIMLGVSTTLSSFKDIRRHLKCHASFEMCPSGGFSNANINKYF